MATFSQVPATLDLTFVRGDNVVIPLQFTGRTLTNYYIAATLYQVLSETAVRGTSYADRVRYAYSTNTLTITTNAVDLSAGKIAMHFHSQSPHSSIASSSSPYIGVGSGKFRFALKWYSYGGAGEDTLTVLSGSVTGIDP